MTLNHDIIISIMGAPEDVTTTSIRIERAKLIELKRRALEENRSLASLIRDLIDEYLGSGRGEAAEKRRASAQRRSIERWAGTSLGKGFAGRDHDDVLYGRRK